MALYKSIIIIIIIKTKT